MIPNKTELLVLYQVLQPALEALLVNLFSGNFICESHNAQVPCKIKSSKPSHMYFPRSFPLPPRACFPASSRVTRRETSVRRKYFQNTFAFLARVCNSHGNKEGTGKLGIFLKITTLCPLAKMAPRMS